MKPDWFPDWTGETCVIVASGPSASNVPIRKAKGAAKFIAINNSVHLAPWADILFACDYSWWKHANGAPSFPGLKLSTEWKASQEDWGVKAVGLKKSDDRLELENIGTVGWGGNSGFHSLNLAVQFGCAKILLVGYDMTVKHGIHWHGKHPAGLNNPSEKNVERWRRAVDAAHRLIEPLGIKVINCSPISALRNYPKMTFEEALAA